MRATKEVCSSENAIALKQLGVKQDSYFVWHHVFGGNKLEIGFHPKCVGDFYSAFTASELFDLLPPLIKTGKNEPFDTFRLQLQKHNAANIQYSLNYYSDTYAVKEDGFLTHPFSPTLFDHSVFEENLANCLAQALIKLFQDNYTATCWHGGIRFDENGNVI